MFRRLMSPPSGDIHCEEHWTSIWSIYVCYYWNQCSRKCQCEFPSTGLPLINHMDVQCSSQWMSPAGGDIRRRNVCQDIIVVNKKRISWWICSYTENARWKQYKGLYWVNIGKDITKSREIQSPGRQWRLEILAGGKFHIQVPLVGFWSSYNVSHLRRTGNGKPHSKKLKGHAIGKHGTWCLNF
jgi:hypothetical protein